MPRRRADGRGEQILDHPRPVGRGDHCAVGDRRAVKQREVEAVDGCLSAIIRDHVVDEHIVEIKPARALALRDIGADETGQRRSSGVVDYLDQIDRRAAARL
ncbi:hypothetical protein [Sphingomonas sp.]|jgi:hypothetical protein|uniref:hypothetical protein n=1 Tax=Sphingomonas sp. TaxID=28214 RepID=UPI002E304F5B|nr:hypothetical protein [Sphingomonas sp.]